MGSKLQAVSFLGRSEFWISLFVTAYILSAVVWLTRKNNPELTQMAKVIHPMVTVLGLDQNWSLFSPEVRRNNLHNIAIIRFQDGSLKLYEWPRMDRSDLFEQARNEKYRKMFIDCIPWGDYTCFLPSVARFVARANANPTNPPTQISLAYFWSEVPPPKHWVKQTELPAQNRFYCYFTYSVQPGDLN